jgi:hypothetical protein
MYCLTTETISERVYFPGEGESTDNVNGPILRWNPNRTENTTDALVMRPRIFWSHQPSQGIPGFRFVMLPVFGRGLRTMIMVTVIPGAAPM